jgi:hypothetical protein
LVRLTPPVGVGIFSNMVSRLLFDRRIVLTPTAFVELVLWKVPTPVVGSGHGFKYRLALVSHGACVLRYDNEAGKGDHVHRGAEEYVYRFQGLDRLLADFETDTRRWLDENGDS